MQEYENAIFISYAWGGEREEVVNQIDEALQKRGVKIIRDKRDLGYKGSIKEFMERIGQGHCIILVISDKYLRSPNCMFELVEIAENKQFYDRVFPIVLNDANIYDPIKRIEYVKHWETKRAELASAMKELDPANLQGIRDDMDLYDRIRDKVSGMTSILKDMNTLTPDMHKDSEFSDLYNAIIKQMEKSAADSSTPESGRADHNATTQSAQKGSGNSSGGGNAQSASVSNAFNFQGANINVGRDMAGGDMVAGNKITTTYGSEPKKAPSLKDAFEKVNQQIDKLADDPDVDKSYLKMFVKDIEKEASKGSDFNEKKLRTSLKMLMQNAEKIYASVAGILRSPDFNVPLEIQNILD